MMSLIHTLIAVITLVSSANAFFPYFPPYMCAEDGQCVNQPNSPRDVKDEVSGIASLKISQRWPKTEVSRDQQVRRTVNKLIRKYNHPSQARGSARDSVEKRRGTNTYSVQTAANPAQTNSAGINQDGTDFSYFAQVQFGSANTPLYMLLDTGASTTWVMGPSCGSDACKSHDSFGAADSKTFKTTTDPFSVAYGAGSVRGTLASDSVSIAGMKFQMTFGIANITSDDFKYFPIDGILGLSLQKGSTPSFIETLVASKAVKSNIFGISLNRASDGDNTGEINFGAVDNSKFTGSLNYLPVSANSAGDWAIPMANVGFGSNQAGVTGKLAYIDTGTSFIFAPPDQAAAFYAVVTGAKILSTGATVTYSVPCDTTTALTFTFGKTTYSVSPKDWVSASVNGVCTGNVFGRTIVADSWLLGDTFLKNVYAVFDVDQTRVGTSRVDRLVENMG
ncbi:aspartic proteinase [Hyaloscypha sp. PMI_1271]|nr:aspartic proteinase [Hyaloscypha sp. PMI_1271]